jgi:prevent-host-death family protein
MSITVGARDLKNRLGSYLRAVREGKTVIVTDRGRPVAELRALREADTESDLVLRRLAAEGRLTLPTIDHLPPRVPLRIEGARLSDAVIEDREDRL